MRIAGLGLSRTNNNAWYSARQSQCGQISDAVSISMAFLFLAILLAQICSAQKAMFNSERPVELHLENAITRSCKELGVSIQLLADRCACILLIYGNAINLMTAGHNTDSQIGCSRANHLHEQSCPNRISPELKRSAAAQTLH